MKLGRILFAFMVIVGWACSSTPQKNEHLLHSVLLYNLHVRRPDHVGAEPRAYFGDYEFESHPRPNAHWDCEPFQWLFKGSNLDAMRECLVKLNKEGKTLSYLLRKADLPYLEVEEEEGTPACVKDFLSQIPVPREIFFQSFEEEQLSCYNARITLTSEEFLGISSALHHHRVKVVFPLESLPETNADMEFLLETWMLGAFFEQGRNQIISRVVPLDICRKCIGEKNLFLDGQNLPPHWPVDTLRSP